LELELEVGRSGPLYKINHFEIPVHPPLQLEAERRGQQQGILHISIQVAQGIIIALFFSL